MKKLPILRFPEFTDAWQESLFGDLVVLRKEKFNPLQSQEKLKDIELEHLETGTGRIVGHTTSDTQKSIKGRFYEGDVLYGKLRPYLQKFAKAPWDGVASTEIWAFKPKLIDGELLLQLVQTSNFIDAVNIQSGSKMPRGDWSIVKEASISLPSSDNEQQKIADFLTAVDRKISILEQKAEKLETYKRGVVQKIFARRIRFSRPDGSHYPEWETKKLGDIGDFYRGLSYDKSNVKNVGNLVLRSSNIQNGKLLLDQDLQFVDKKAQENQKLQKSDIVICMANGSRSLVGKSAVYDGSYNGEITVGAFCSIFRSQNPLAKILLDTSKYSRYLDMLLAGTNINNLKNSDLAELEFTIPADPEEQQKIADFLSAIDQKITLTTAQLEKTKEFKKGLLQRMFV